MDFAFELFILAIIALPGFYVNGILINFIDILLPVLGLYSLKGKVSINRSQKFLLLYIFAIFFSILSAAWIGKTIEISTYFKCARIAFAILIYPIVIRYTKRTRFDIKRFNRLILISGIISSVIGIVLFFIQSNMYQAAETLYFMGKVMHRAGGVFAEAATFSLMMSMIFVFAYENLWKKESIKLSLVCLVFSFVGIVISDTRIAIFSVAFVLVFSLFREKKITAKSLLIFFVLALCIYIAYLKSGLFQRFLNDRVLVTIEGLLFNRTNLNALSSNRTSIWNMRLEQYISGNAIQILFGNGYKVGIGALSDNNYISALYYTGIFGLLTFAIYWINNIKLLFKKGGYFFNIYEDMLFLFLIFMITCDAMTMTRPFYFFIIISSIFYSQTKRGNLYENNIH